MTIICNLFVSYAAPNDGTASEVEVLEKYTKSPVLLDQWVTNFSDKGPNFAAISLFGPQIRILAKRAIV